MSDYSWITEEMFYDKLVEIIDETQAPSDLLALEGVYEIVREEFNNEVLKALEEERAEGED